MMRTKTAFKIYFMTCVLAAIIPFLPVKPVSRQDHGTFPGWPEQFDGVTLQKLPLSAREEQLAQGFTGRIACFTDGEREIILRWTSLAQKNLSSALDYFKRQHYNVTFRDIWKDPNRVYWRSFDATKTNEHLRVWERIYDAAGNSWTETPTWYWAVLWGKTRGPWWVIAMIEQQ
jgi:hypothetical protein